MSDGWRAAGVGLLKRLLPGFLETVEVETFDEGKLYEVRVSRFKTALVRELVRGTLKEAIARADELAAKDDA